MSLQKDAKRSVNDLEKQLHTICCANMAFHSFPNLGWQKLEL